MSSFQVPEGVRLPALHPEKVRGARHIDVKKRSAHQEIGGFGRHVLGKLRKPLGRDDPRQPALAASAHQVCHRIERELARLIRNFACDRRRE